MKTFSRARRRAAAADRSARRPYRAPARADPAVRALLRAPSPGTPLPDAARSQFEPRFGADLGEVRVHTGPEAAASAESLDARAYTLGRDIVFGRGEYSPDTTPGRRLLAHELTHTLQPDGTLRRAPRVGNMDWPFNHGDVAHGHPVDLLTVAITTLGVEKADARTLAQAAASRGQWTAKKDLYVLAFDFLRDNVKRFDVPDTAELVARVLDFCDQSTASAGALKDDFYSSLLASAVYSAGPGSAGFSHQLGTHHKVPGRAAGATDFAPSGDNALLRANPERATTKGGGPNARVTGGFSAQTDLLVAYGAQQGSVASSSVTLMLDQHAKRIPSRLRPFVEAVATDPSIFSVLQKFLRDDGGAFKLQPVSMGGAHYTPGKPPSIEVDPDVFPGSRKQREMSGIIVRSTLAHELYHYALDRADTALAELGDDHHLIQVVEERYIIVAQLLAGQPPLHDRISALGAGIRSHLGSALKSLISADDPGRLRAFVGSQDFLDATVFGLLMPPVGNLEDRVGGKSSMAGFLMDPSQITDLGYLAAINGVLLRRAFELAADLAERKPRTPLDRVWSHPDYQKEIRVFIGRFIGLASQNRQDGATALAATIR